MKNQISFLIVTIISFLCFSCDKKKEVNTGKTNKIFDVHLHSDWWGKPNMVAFTRKEYVGYKDEKTFVDSTLWYIKKYNFVKAVTDGSNAYAMAQKEPSVIIPAIEAYGKPIDSLRKWFSKGKYKVMAEFSPQYAGLSPNDPKLDPYFSLAEEMNIPVGMHIGLGPPGAKYMTSTQYKMANSRAILLEDALIKHPKLRIYVMHAGWPYLDDIIALLYAYPQVYIDIAVINWFIPKAEFQNYLKRIVQAGFADRIMYGSDQMQWPQAIKESIENIETIDFLTEQQKEDIFYNNAIKFFGIKESPTKSLN